MNFLLYDNIPVLIKNTLFKVSSALVSSITCPGSLDANAMSSRFLGAIVTNYRF